VIAAAAAACACGVAAVAVASSGGTTPTSATAVARQVTSAPEPPPLKPHPTVVRAVGPGDAPPADGVTAGNGTVGAGPPPTDADVRSELTQFRQHLNSVGGPRGAVPSVRPDGTAVAAVGTPGVVATVIAAGNAIATTPYKWGGGHGAWRDSGYDCSGSVSFALAGAGLLSSPLTAAQFMTWGDPGPGRYITIYASAGHVFMVVDGLRFDTSGAQGGTRWQPAAGRSYGGFTAVHPPGL
jgi:cell wall-associated NlpC family hydrolase